MELFNLPGQLMTSLNRRRTPYAVRCHCLHLTLPARTPRLLGNFIEADYRDWRNVVKTQNLKLDQFWLFAKVHN